MSITMLDAFVFPKIFCQNQKEVFSFQNTCIVYIVINQFLFWFLFHTSFHKCIMYTFMTSLHQKKIYLIIKILLFLPALTRHDWFKESEARRHQPHIDSTLDLKLERWLMKMLPDLIKWSKPHKNWRKCYWKIMRNTVNKWQRESGYWRPYPNRGSYRIRDYSRRASLSNWFHTDSYVTISRDVSFTKYHSTSCSDNSKDMSNIFTTYRGIHISSCDSINRTSAWIGAIQS